MTMPLLDITGDVCPMTFVKVKMGLQQIAPPGKLNVRLKEEALKNVISSLKAEGHRVTNVSREGTIFLLEVEKPPERQSNNRETETGDPLKKNRKVETIAAQAGVGRTRRTAPSAYRSTRPPSTDMSASGRTRVRLLAGREPDAAGDGEGSRGSRGWYPRRRIFPRGWRRSPP